MSFLSYIILGFTSPCLNSASPVRSGQHQDPNFHWLAAQFSFSLCLFWCFTYCSKFSMGLGEFPGQLKFPSVPRLAVIVKSHTDLAMRKPTAVTLEHGSVSVLICLDMKHKRQSSHSCQQLIILFYAKLHSSRCTSFSHCMTRCCDWWLMFCQKSEI